MKSLERTSLALRRNLLLGTIFDRLARVHGDGRLVDEAGGETLTYADAADRVARMAAGIAAKIEPGDRVVVAVANTYDLLLLVVAAARAGGVAVPVNPKMRNEEIEYVVDDSGASLVIHDPGEVLADEPQAEAVAADPSDVAAIFYTSGTTGHPKGARLTHEALLAQAAPGAVWPSRLRRDEAVVGLPVAHIMGFVVLLAFAAAGIPVYFLPKFKPEAALDAIEERRCTMFVGVPAMYRLMLDAGAEDRDLGCIRMWASGADKLPPELARKFKSFGASMTIPFTSINVGEAAFAEGYGMVELAGGVAAKVSPPYLPLAIGDFLGLPLPPYRLRVVDDDGNDVRPGSTGELWVKGPGVLKGYHGRPDETAEVLSEDGWLRTGDMARKGPLGLVFFVGRSKDVIKHGGYSVFAAEVEGGLEQHPDVAEAAVLGLPDDRKGEIPVAAVRLRSGATLTGEELAAWARDHMSDYKAPRRIVVVDDLPRTGTDKVQKSELLSLFEESAEPSD
jgi:acyl-CoA synthetase (AMP-forming)/AMP-acid ligase II